MGTYNPMITQMIQDAVLKLCTQNIMFQKSLEIDGIICVSSGEEQRDIVVKMHRTIVKPEVAPTPVESWSPSLEADWQNTANTNTPRNTSFDSYDSSTPIGNRRSESRPGHRGPYKSKHTVVNEPPKRTFNEVHEPPEPTATLETPGGLDIDSDYSVTNIKAEPDTSPNSKRKNSDSNIDQNEEVPAKLAKYNIKEEAITIELNDEDDDDGGEGDTETAGASWMGAEGDDTTRTYDNMDSMNNTYASADTGDESQMHDAGGAMQGAGGDMQGAGGDMGDQSVQSLLARISSLDRENQILRQSQKQTGSSSEEVSERENTLRERRYIPKTRSPLPLCHPVMLSKDELPKPEWMRLVQHMDVAVPKAWLAQILIQSKTKKQSRQECPADPGKICRALLDGLFEPEELSGKGGLGFYTKDKKKGPILLAVKGYTETILHYNNFTRIFNEKVAANRNIIKKIGLLD